MKASWRKGLRRKQRPHLSPGTHRCSDCSVQQDKLEDLKILSTRVAPSLGVTNHLLNLPLPLLPEWAWFERASCSTAVPRKQSKMSNVQRRKSPSESPGYQKNLDKAAQEAGTGQKRSESNECKWMWCGCFGMVMRMPFVSFCYQGADFANSSKRLWRDR